MANVTVRKNVGPSGLADVRISKNSVKVNFINGDTYDMPIEAWREGYPSGKYTVSLSAAGDKIFGIAPVPGQYIFKFKQLGNRGATGLPNQKVQRGGPRSRELPNGKISAWMQPDELVFTVQFEVFPEIESNGVYGGLTVSSNFPFSFRRPESGSVVQLVDSTYNLERLEKLFLVTTGKTLQDLDVEYSDDPTELLLRVEKFLQDNSRPFMASINEKGWMDGKSMVSVPMDLIPKKKTTKKGKK